MVRENMQKGNGHVFVLDPVEVSDVPRLALTLTQQKRVEHPKMLQRALCTELSLAVDHSDSGRFAGDFVTWRYRL